MFPWRVSTYAQQSPVDAILEKGHVILEDLLEIDDIAKEAKVLNGRLVTYLKKPDTLRQLLKYLIGQPPAVKKGQPGSQEQADARTKHSLAACEVLCGLADELPGALAGNNELLHLLFSATGSTTSLDCALAGYFARLVGILLTRCAEQMLAFHEANRGILDSLLEHLDTAGMAETFVRIVGADEQAVPNLPPESLAWLSEMDIITRLLRRLDEDARTGAHGNVAEVLAAIARSRSSPLTGQLCEPSNLESLISRAVVPPPQAPSVQALNIYIALLERRRLLATAVRNSTEAAAQSAEADGDLSAVIQAMVPHMPTLASVLSTAHATTMLETSYGVLRPPLGSVRLTVIELVAVLLRTGSQEAEAAIIDSSIVREILAVFLRFPFNSILHHQVTSIVACLLEAGSDAIVGHLFGDCDLLGWLLNAPAQFAPEQRPGDTRKRAPLRAGYMGHLTEIANSLQTVAARRPPVAQLLCSNTAWTDFAFGPLSERNQLEDVLSWRCGHPQMRGVAAVAKDGDTEMPDLQLDALANLERHAGRYSAFSDEEDDDELHSLYLDASGDSDLWDLAAHDGGEAIPRLGSPSPFASRSLLGSFDADDERDTSWMRRPSLLAAGGAKGEEPSDEDELRGNGSPPATWEDRADGDFDRPDGDFENCASWMDTDDLDEDGKVLTASPEPAGSGGTPDLLADSPPEQPNAPSPNAARVTPRVLFPTLQTPKTEIAAPAAIAVSPRAAQDVAAAEIPGGGSGGGEWVRGRESERGVMGDRVVSPVGCYSTLASHHSGRGESGGHELPACFASPPTSPPLTARTHQPEEPMDTISLADATAAAAASTAGSTIPDSTTAGSSETGPIEPHSALGTTPGAESSEAAAPKAAGAHMGGLRDLFAPVGGLFKGTFMGSSQHAAAKLADREQPEADTMQQADHTAADRDLQFADATAAAHNEGESAAQSSFVGEASEATPSLSADVLHLNSAPVQDVNSCEASKDLPESTSMSNDATDSAGSKAETGSIHGGQTAAVNQIGDPGTIAGAVLVPDHFDHGSEQAQSSTHLPEQPDNRGSTHTDKGGAATIVEQEETGRAEPLDESGSSAAVPGSTEGPMSAESSSDGELHRESLQDGARPLASSQFAPSSDHTAAAADIGEAGKEATADPSSHAAYLPDTSMAQDSRSSHHSGHAKPPFRGKHRRWAETDTILVPRGELEEETLVGSFTKLLVSQDEDFAVERAAAAAAGPSPGRGGHLSLSCAQQAPKAAHSTAVERELPE